MSGAKGGKQVRKSESVPGPKSNGTENRPMKRSSFKPQTCGCGCGMILGPAERHQRVFVRLKDDKRPILEGDHCIAVLRDSCNKKKLGEKLVREGLLNPKTQKVFLRPHGATRDFCRREAPPQVSVGVVCAVGNVDFGHND